MNCDAKIRPFPNDTELVCGVTEDDHLEHRVVLEDYAYPGSRSVIHWQEADRRTFHGEWPGPCPGAGYRVRAPRPPPRRARTLTG